MSENETLAADAAKPAGVRIEKLVYGGEGLGRIDGQVVLTPYVLPGELVTLETQRVKTGLLRGRALQIAEGSPHRITPRCPYFGSCGGCQYQHTGYEFQLEQKVSILRETLRRLGGLDFGDEIPVISGEPWFYRNRIQLHVQNGEIGFHKLGSRDVQPIDHCYISAPELVEAISRFSKAVRRPEWPSFLRSFELFSNGSELQLNVLDTMRPVAARFFDWCGTLLPSLRPGALNYRAAGFDFRISGSSFFQVNRFLIDELVKEVIGDAEGESAVDLYAGVGLFSLPLAKRFSRVDAVERGASAIRDLKVNNEQSGSGIRIFQASTEDHLASSVESSPDLVLADPPRGGLGHQAVAEIVRLKPARLTLVSCDPATLARDLKELLTAYRVRRLTLADLFPQTYHFETIAHLERS